MDNKKRGLSSSEAQISRGTYGSNALEKIKGKSLFGRFLENLSDPIIRILLIALFLEVIFTLGRCNWYEIIGIVTAILIATVVSTLSEYGSEKAFESLREREEESCDVLRDGIRKALPINDIVVGDIVYICAGEHVPADGTVIEGECSVDQSALNGENAEVIKRVSRNSGNELSCEGRIFRGSSVNSGSCVMRVDKVGDATFFGSVARDVQVRTRISPLKLRLSALAGKISRLGYIAAALVGLAYLFSTFVSDNGYVAERIVASLKDTRFVLSTLIKALTLMITVVVVAVPEGLPMMITVVLSANMRKMLRDNILVKKLVGIETAGSLNILFTDKTGTLTEGKMRLDRIILAGKTLSAENICKGLSSAEQELLTLNAYYNTDSRLDGGVAVGGNATERAILDGFSSLGKPTATATERTPFSSEKKLSSVRLSTGECIIKGAPDLLLSRTAFILSTDGRAVSSDLSYAIREYERAVKRGERVVAVVKDDGGEHYIFVALLVLADRIRCGVRTAVKQVREAGIQTVVVTGDNLDSAVAIAEDCGIYSEYSGHIALDSTALSGLSDDELKEKMADIRVVARALPSDKTRLVRVCQEMGLVVGMTGDGINDAPSLKLADVGFGMGSGTEIARSASDVVILDNSYTSISKTVLYGRTIFKSIRKFIVFQLIMNLAACGITLIGQFLGIENPITIIQMLWVNIIMDTLGGLAFAGEAPLAYYMKEKPKSREEPIISSDALKHIVFNGVYTLLLLLLFLTGPFFKSVYSGSNARLMCAFYALFIFAGLFNCFAARCERVNIFSNITKNKPFLLIMGVILAIQIFIIYCGGELFRSAPLSIRELFITFFIAFSVLVFDFLRRIAVKLK